MSALSIGLSALNADQQLINITGQNIANANTQGYHLQVPNLVAITTGNNVGAGVMINDVTRSWDPLIESAIYSNTSDQQNTTTQLNNMSQVQSNLAPSSGSISDQLTSFFSDIDQLASNPSDMAQRTVVVQDASSLANTLNAGTTSLQTLTQNLDTQANSIVTNINTYSQQIATLNGQIQQATSLGQSPNDLLDQRDEAVSQLSQLINLQVIPIQSNEVNVIAAGAPVVVGTQQLNLGYTVNGTNQGNFFRADEGISLNVTGGQAAGLLQVRNQELPSISNQLDTLSQSLITNIDEIQATGLGLNGPMTSINGSRSVSDPTMALDDPANNVAFPPQTGTLCVSMTNTSTGARTLTQVNITPTMSLQDVATALSSVPNLSASVNINSNTLHIQAANGYAFDFAGQLPTSPVPTGDPASLALAPGASASLANSVQVSGTYTGTTNDIYTYSVSGDGTVGVTPGMTLNVTNQSGQSVGSFNIGQGYTGSALTVNGVTIQIPADGSVNVNTGDSCQIPVTTDLSNMVQVSGTYTGTTNDIYTYSVSGDGTVGVTPGLTLNVTNQSGQSVGSFNIGQGYSPGTALSAINGVTAQVAAGDVNAVDPCQVPVTANSDTAKILTALGVNTLFTGTTAGTIAVNPDLLQAPELLNASLNGTTGDSSNLQRILALQNTNVLASPGQTTASETFSGYTASMIGSIGTQVQNLTDQQTAQQSLGQSLQAQQQSVSGVNTDDEMVNLLQYQQSYQMASEYISVVNTTLSSLLNLIQTSSS